MNSIFSGMFKSSIRKKILIAEDHDDIRDMMIIFVDEIGFEPISASDGQEAIELALKHMPDLVLMDIAMPVTDGVEAAAVMRTHDLLAHIPIIAVTAYSSNVPDHVKTDNFDHIIDKPVDIYTLKPILERFTSRQSYKESI
jgi:CheY-like chemotaxis protein